MKIVEVRSAVAVLPLSKPVGWATAAVSEREYILVWVVGDDGSYGLGYGLGTRFPGGAKIIHDIVQEQLAPVALARSSSMTEKLWDLLHQPDAVAWSPGGGHARNEQPRYRALGS